MQKEVDSLVAQVNELEQRVAQGEFDPAKTKVLHLAINPESMAQAERTETIAALKTENEHLSKKVAELMEGKATAPQAALLLGGESAVVMQKSQLLERKLKETELKMQRLKEVPTLSPAPTPSPAWRTETVFFFFFLFPHARFLERRSPSFERPVTA